MTNNKLPEFRVREIASSGWDKGCCTSHEAAALAKEVLELRKKLSRAAVYQDLQELKLK